MAGGPPVRGDLLGYWEPDGPVADTDRARWAAAAARIRSGLATLAHLDATVAPDLLVIAFSCGRDLTLATGYERAIRTENIEGRLIEAGDGTYGIALPCRPEATNEEIRHVVLAGLKAAHAVEFVPITDPHVLDQLAAVRAVEACVVDLGRKVKRFGAGVRRRVGTVSPESAVRRD